ncbi:hypothetical protein D3C87_2165390 [compost metagenome]
MQVCGQTDRDGERDNAPHARPADNEAVFEIEQRIFADPATAAFEAFLEIGPLPENAQHAE